MRNSKNNKDSKEVKEERREKKKEMEHKVEMLGREDAAEISKVYREVWPKAYEYPEEWRRKRAMSEEEVLKEMDAGYMFFGVRVNGKLVGVYKASFTDRGLFGEQLAVLPSHRNQGVANALYEHFLNLARKNKCRGYVNILLGHKACERVIRKYGFKKVGEPWEQSKGMLVQTYEKDFSHLLNDNAQTTTHLPKLQEKSEDS